jgi:hypothetical protein
MRTLALSITVSSVLFAACVQPGSSDVGEVRRALPTAEGVRINLPEQAQQSFALGQLADYYVITRTISRDLNAGAAWVLLVVHTVVQFPPTSVSGATYTWGPWSGALDPAEYRLVVTARADGSYDWHLDGRSKTEPGAELEVVISGNAVPGDEPHRGHGTFFIDFDAGARVNPVDTDARGTVEVAYDLENRYGAPATLTMIIDTVQLDDSGDEAPARFEYAYAENLDRSGDLIFAIHADLDGGGTAMEEAVIRSRWLADGAGRADVRAEGGDLDDLVVTASECWDQTFRRVYYADSHEWLPTEGAEADCAFADQDLP